MHFILLAKNIMINFGKSGGSGSDGGGSGWKIGASTSLVVRLNFRSDFANAA